MKIRNLHDLLMGALVCAGNDESLPTLASVYLEIKEGKLTAMATDRYRLIVGTVALEVEPAQTRTLLATRDSVERAVLVLKKALSAKGKEKSQEVSITDPGTGSWDLAGEGFQIALEGKEGNFPPTRHLLDKEVIAIETVAFNPKFLGSIAKLAHQLSPKDPVTLTFISSGGFAASMAKFEISHLDIEWKALLMPMRTIAQK